jgi:uncharacterized membrane protein YfcA
LFATTVAFADFDLSVTLVMIIGAIMGGFIGAASIKNARKQQLKRHLAACSCLS